MKTDKPIKRGNAPKRVAIYARVSTLDKKQDPETQLRQLREYIERRDYQLVDEYVDYASGTSEARSQHQALDRVRKRKVDVWCWSGAMIVLPALHKH